MKIHIILNDPYPYGMANSNRIHLYARGLIKHGNDVKIIIPKPKVFNKSVKVKKSDIYDGVPYHYTSSPYRSNSFIKRRIDVLFGALNALIYCTKEKPEAIIIISENLFHFLLFKTVSWLVGASIFLEKTEVPYMKKDKINKLQKVYLGKIFSLFDGIITITDQLSNYLTNELKVNSKVIIIPILIDERNIHNYEEKVSRKNYILYSGSFAERKDGILTILKSLPKVFKEVPDLKLFITGNAKKTADFSQAEEIINNENISTNIHFTGYLSQEDLNIYMREAKLLILGKPLNRQNIYNFPTKLGEYLISGAPVLCTYMETFDAYFEENENIFMTDLDAEKIADKILEILSNPELAENVASKGKEVAIQEFETTKQTKRLQDFLVETR